VENAQQKELDGGGDTDEFREDGAVVDEFVVGEKVGSGNFDFSFGGGGDEDEKISGDQDDEESGVDEESGKSGVDEEFEIGNS
jgi:hypothetical protein